MRYRLAALAAVTAAAAAACSSAATSAAPPASATAVARTSSAAAAPRAASGNITIAPSGRYAPGPFKITPLYCGKFTAAQQSQFGTTAAGGLIYRYSNGSNTLPGSAKLFVTFTDGQTAVGDNVTGSGMPMTEPGQNATAEVDAVGGSGQDLKFTGCEVTGYAVVTSSGVLGQYAP